jgi:hypothetical protein
MTKALLTKILIGVFATGTVGTVGLVVASKVPATAQYIEQVPVLQEYVDLVTFTEKEEGLTEEEFEFIMNIDEKFYIPKYTAVYEKYNLPVPPDFNSPNYGLYPYSTLEEFAIATDKDPSLLERNQAKNQEIDAIMREGQSIEHELIQRMNKKQKQELGKKRLNGKTYEEVYEETKNTSQQLEEQIKKEQEQMEQMQKQYELQQAQ